MKKEKLLFFIIPIIQVLSSVRYFKSYKQAVSSIIFIISSVMVSLLIYKVLSVLFSKNNNYFIPLSVLLLAFLDQAHKFLLEITGLNCNIIGEFFKVRQTHNENQAAILNHFSISLNLPLVICLKVLLLIIFAVCLYKIKNPDLKIGCILLASAQITSIFDSIYRGYILDSFYYYKLVCYDLKDYYVDAGVALIFMAALFAAKKDNAVKERANEKTEKRDTSGSSV